MLVAIAPYKPLDYNIGFVDGICWTWACKDNAHIDVESKRDRWVVGAQDQ